MGGWKWNSFCPLGGTLGHMRVDLLFEKWDLAPYDLWLPTTNPTYAPKKHSKILTSRWDK